jgi:acyl-CoA thioesterase
VVIRRERRQNAPVSEFDDATFVADDGTTAIAPGWDIGGNANGGYVLAILGRALRDASGQPDPITLTSHFLAPATAGPARAIASVVKAGRRFTTMTGSLYQGDREIVRVIGTFGDLRAGGDAVDYDRLDAAELPPPEECVERPVTNGNVPVPLTDRVSVLLHPAQAGYRQGRRSGTAQISGWFSFRDGRPVDTLALLLAADAFPPAVFNIDLPSGWVPTVNLTVQVRAHPCAGALRCRFTTRHVASGMFEEDGELWDSSGRLVALSRQLALIARG